MERGPRGGAPTYQIELLLKLFVGVIDAKLFEAVNVEGFEAERKGRQPPGQKQPIRVWPPSRPKPPYLPINVQHADEGVLFSGNLQRPVYPGDDAVKEVGVDLLGQSVSGV